MDNSHRIQDSKFEIESEEGSEYDRLFYPYLFEGGTSNVDEVLAQVEHSTLEKCHEVVALRRALLAGYRDTIVSAGTAMARAFASGGTLLAFGNGGSTTDAQDIVADLSNPPADFRFSISDFGSKTGEHARTQKQDPATENLEPRTPRPLPAISLTGDIAVVTAVANDVGVDNIFARQVIAFGRPGDIAFGISTSGNSANVVAALEQAKKQGMLTVALAGYDGGKMARSAAVDFCIVAVSDHIPRIQETQATAYHALLEVIWAAQSQGPTGNLPA